MALRVWLMVLCGGSILTLVMGIRQSFGLFLAPISLDFVIGRESLAIAIALQNLIWGAVAPFAGAMADRFGALKVVVAGGLVYVLSLAITATGADILQVQTGLTLIGVATGIISFNVVLGAVGRATPESRRSFAHGITAAGGSFGQFAIVPVGQVFLSVYGWQTALWLCAAMAFLIVPLAYGVAERAAAASTAATQSLSEALSEASNHSGFWLLTAGFFVCGFHVAFVATHLPAFISDKGLPAWLGAASLSLIGLFNIVGTLSAGWLGGRFRKKYVLALIYLGRAVVFLGFLWLPVSEVSVLAFGALLGLLWLGTVPLTSGLVAQIFGPAYMSMLFGIVFFSHQVGSFFGAWLGGHLYDVTGSYGPVWWASVALGVGAALLHWPIADRPVPRLAPATA
jgi:predicted MFS family arabinose efflux permease